MGRTINTRRIIYARRIMYTSRICSSLLATVVAGRDGVAAKAVPALTVLSASNYTHESVNRLVPIYAYCFIT